MPSLLATALETFDQHVFRAVVGSVVKGLFAELEAERSGEHIDWVNIREVIKVPLRLTRSASRCWATKTLRSGRLTMEG